MPKPHGVVAYLDGIRGVAAFFVFVHHFLLAFYTSYYTFDVSASHLGGFEVLFGRSVFSVFTNGNFWVHVFFVLSGFVLSRKYYHTNDFSELVSALHRRFIRLYIPVAFTLVIAFVMMQAGLFMNKPVSIIAHSEWWFGGMWDFPQAAEKLLGCLAYGTMFQGDSSFDTSMWTLSYEFYGSLFVYAFLAFTHFTRYRVVMMALAAYYFCSLHQTLYVCFVLGMSLCYFEQRNYTERWQRYISIILLPLALILGSYPSSGGHQGTLFQDLGHTLVAYNGWFHAVGAYFLVLSFVLWPVLQRVMANRYFRFLGYISFSLYLVHALVLGSFSSWLFLHLYPSLGYNGAVYIVFTLTLPLLFVISWLMAKYIDEPGIIFAKRTYLLLSRKQPGFQNL